MSEINRLRKIPSVSEIVELVLREPWGRDYAREQIVTAAREELTAVRKQLASGISFDVDSSDLLQKLHTRLKTLHDFSLRSVINATGIIVHTNLGRSPLSPEAAKQVSQIASGYSNLEFDLEKGERGSREIHLEKFLTRLFPVEAALVVNNNASALLLILNTLAEGKEVIVSRGELIEIGGSFRLPEIMRKSGAILREVGTTNKTRLNDYRKAVGPNTAMILAVHPSNYRIIGFTEKPSLSELALLGRELGIPIVEDEGSGILLNLESFGISEEPGVQSSFQEGADLVCFSGDKILGGPQAGIVCGKKEWIEKLRSNSLFRALRVDKMVYAALQATLLHYLKSELTRIPVISMISVSEGELRGRGKRWLSQLQKKFPNAEWQLESTTCYIGGGVAPMKGLPSVAVVLSHPDFSANSISQQLRKSDPPIVTRIEDERLFFELRTISTEEEKWITAALEKILTEQSG